MRRTTSTRCARRAPAIAAALLALALGAPATAAAGPLQLPKGYHVTAVSASYTYAIDEYDVLEPGKLVRHQDEAGGYKLTKRTAVGFGIRVPVRGLSTGNAWDLAHSCKYGYRWQDFDGSLDIALDRQGGKVEVVMAPIVSWGRDDSECGQIGPNPTTYHVVYPLSRFRSARIVLETTANDNINGNRYAGKIRVVIERVKKRSRRHGR